MRNNLRAVLTAALLVVAARTARSQASQPREQRWAVFGEPYQQRVVSLIPGAQQAPWSPNTYSSPIPSIPQPPPWSPLPPAPPVNYVPDIPAASVIPGVPQPPPWSPIPPASPIPGIPPPWSPVSSAPLSPTFSGAHPLWPPIMPEAWSSPLNVQPQVPLYSSPTSGPYLWPPAVAPVSLVAPAALLEPQESSSRDLDVGVYTGMDSPWTQLPPFSRTLNTAAAPSLGGLLPAGYTLTPSYGVTPSGFGVARGGVQPWESSSRDLDVGVATGDDSARYWPRQSWQTATPYPWLRQQGGFSVKRADDDVKLTMHVPKDGLPGGVLVMEMKASVYRPVY